MAPRGKRKNEEGAEENILSKEDEAIAKYIRFNTPTESTLFQGNDVHYFNGNKAVDTLYDSKYGSKAKGEPKFADRKAAVRFLEELMNRQMFWRARKLVPKKKEDKEKKIKGSGEDSTKSPDTPRPKTKKKGEKVSEAETAGETEVDEKPEKKKEGKEEEKDKKKKKVKLEVHSSQVFNDASDVYVWVFDPTPLFKKVIGAMMVLGTIAGCLFPLWPMWLRQGVYYLSLAGIGAFGAIVVTAILRTILFGIIWALTMGRHHLWILPNLTEDCGFFESFQPYYTYEYRPEGKAPKQDKKKKGKKDKDSDDESDPLMENEKNKEQEETAEKEEEKENGGGSGEEQNGRSLSGSDEEGSASEGSSSVPPSPADSKPVRRRARKADDDFVVVGK